MNRSGEICASISEWRTSRPNGKRTGTMPTPGENVKPAHCQPAFSRRINALSARTTPYKRRSAPDGYWRPSSRVSSPRVARRADRRTGRRSRSRTGVQAPRASLRESPRFDGPWPICRFIAVETPSIRLSGDRARKSRFSPVCRQSPGFLA